MIPTTQEVKQSWNAYAELYSQVMEKTNVQIGLSLSRMLQLHSAQSILEVGCGSGSLAVELLKSLPSGIKYTSVDLSEEMIKLAEKRKQICSSQLNNIDHKFVVGDAEDLSFIPDESVDVYISSLCIHLIPDPTKALKEAMRVVKKGGKVGFSVLAKYENCDVFTLFGDRVKEFKIEVPQKRSMFRYGDREALMKLIEEGGFQVDYCWLENVTMGIHDENDLDIVSKSPSNLKIINQLDEENRVKFLEAINKEFQERKKKFLPLQNENVLLIGRKSQ